MPKLFLLDFDHTLFDTEKLKEAIKDQLRKLQLSDDLIQDLFVTFRSHRYRPYYHQQAIQAFCEKHQLTEMRDKLYQSLLDNDFASMVYPDTEKVLKELNTIGITSIFTTGDGLYQQVKIQQSGVAKLVKKIFIFDNKMDHFAEIVQSFPDHQIWYVDNQITLLEEANNLLPTVKTAWMKTIDEENQPSQFQPTVTVNNLTEFVESAKKKDQQN